MIEKIDFVKFHNRDDDFMENRYPYLPEEEKIFLWESLLTVDFSRNSFVTDRLCVFTKENYKKWLEEEPDFDRFLDQIIEEFMPAFGIWYERCREHNLKTEIYIRLGKIPTA